MAAQSKRDTTNRYNDTFPTKLRSLLAQHPKDGRTTTYKELGEAVGVRQQSISLYASGQVDPTAGMLLRIAQYFGVSVDYLLTGVSSQNQGYADDLGLSEESIELLRIARKEYPKTRSKATDTIPHLDELLSDRDFYGFLEELNDYILSIKKIRKMSKDELKQQFHGFNIDAYLIWELQKFVEKFVVDKVNKLLWPEVQIEVV